MAFEQNFSKDLNILEYFGYNIFSPLEFIPATKNGEQYGHYYRRISGKRS